MEALFNAGCWGCHECYSFVSFTVSTLYAPSGHNGRGVENKIKDDILKKLVSVERFNLFMFQSVNPPAFRGWKPDSQLYSLAAIQNLQPAAIICPLGMFEGGRQWARGHVRGSVFLSPEDEATTVTRDKDERRAGRGRWRKIFCTQKKPISENVCIFSQRLAFPLLI